MAVVSISVPDPMKNYIEERVNEGGFSTTSEYFHDLVREDQKRREAERTEALLLSGLESPASDWTDQDVSFVKNAVRERIAKKQKQA